MEEPKSDTKILIYRDGEQIWITLAEFMHMLEELRNG